MAELEKSEIGSSNLEDCVNYVVDLSTNLNDIWTSGDYVTQSKLQNLLFPEGIRYDRENGAFRTTRVNTLFALIPEMILVVAGQKKGSKENISFDPVKWALLDSNQ